MPRKPFQLPLIWYIYQLSRSLIWAEIWSFDPNGSTRFGQSSTTRILDPGRPKNQILGENFFFMVFNKLTKNHANRWWSCQILFWNWLIWYGITLLGFVQFDSTSLTDFIIPHFDDNFLHNISRCVIQSSFDIYAHRDSLI